VRRRQLANAEAHPLAETQGGGIHRSRPLKKVLNGLRYAVTVVHRIPSDITPLLDTARLRGRQTVLGGDLNVSPQMGYADTRAHELVIERIKAFGMIDCLGKFHDGFVQTHKAKNSTTPC
jgi:hypothetical protein